LAAPCNGAQNGDNIVKRLSEQTDNGSEIVPLNSPVGSTMQWGAGLGAVRGSPFVAVVITVVF